MTTDAHQRKPRSDAPLEGRAALDLYLRGRGRSVTAITEPSVLLLKASEGRSCGGPRGRGLPPVQRSRNRRLATSRHLPPLALRLAPSLERGPQPAVKPEAIDRRRGGDCAD